MTDGRVTLTGIREAVQTGDDDTVRDLTRAALESGIAASDVLHRGLLDAMSEVGHRFRSREIFLPDVLLSARAMHVAMELLEPYLISANVPTRGAVVLGTVEGDIHDIGKNLVGIMLRGAGFDVIDLGTDVPATRFVDTAVDRGARVIGLSALLTTTMTAMRGVIDVLERRDLRTRIRTIVGGAPVTDAFAREIGADAFAFDAVSAVDRVVELVERK